MYKAKLILIALFGTYLVSAQIVKNNTCSKVELMKNFNPTEYQGVWHEIYRYGPNNETFAKKDVQYKFTYIDANKTFNVHHNGLRNNKIFNWNGTSSIDSSNASKFDISYSNVDKQMNHWILATDNAKYSLVYGCIDSIDKNNNNQSTVFGWLLSRSLTLNLTSEINSTLTKAGLDLDKFHLNEFTNGALFTTATGLLVTMCIIFNLSV